MSGLDPGAACVARTSNCMISPSAVLSVPSRGVASATATPAFASGSRSATSCRARRMSVPSRKTTVTSEMPSRDTLRISSTPGRPLTARSTG